MVKPKHNHMETDLHEAVRLNRAEIPHAFLIARHHNPRGILHRLPTETVTGKKAPKAYVRLYRGQWIIDCPFCTSAQHASAEDHRWFCAYCRNETVDFQYVDAVWPDQKLLDKIEAVVEARPKMENRNWYPGETVAELKKENKAAGLSTAA